MQPSSLDPLANAGQCEAWMKSNAWLGNGSRREERERRREGRPLSMEKAT